MKAKVLVVGAVFLALAAVTASLRPVPDPRPAPPAPAAKPNPADHPAMASYRVFEETTADGELRFRGITYRAGVTPEGIQFEGNGRRLTLRARQVEQGSRSVELSHAAPVRPRFAAATVDRGEGVTEEFVFENRRAEQIVRIDRPIGEGALTVRIAAVGDFHDVKEIAPGGWTDTTFRNGGLSFQDAAGVPVFAYHTAIAIDAKGRRHQFLPRWTGGEIALEVPATFMKDAAYPVLVDPFLELDFSASGGGISGTGSVSESASIILQGGNPQVAWSDESDGDFDIYFRYWNGFEWTALGTSASPGGVSANAGKSINPSLAYWEQGPVIAWEDDTSGTISVNLKVWTNGLAWSELAGSSTSGGISKMIGVEARRPQVGAVDVLVPNIPTVVRELPVVVWEARNVGILCRFFYPGDARASSPPAGWYSHPSGAFVSANPSAARPSMRVDEATNQVLVAWEESDGTEYDIMFARSGSAGTYTVDPGVLGIVVGPAGTWDGMGGGAPDVVSPGGGALSIQASLALDGSGFPWVAWQETVGAEREIYVATSSGAAFAGVGGSATGLGISQTGTGGTTTSSFPAIGVNTFGTARPVVAWEDDASGNHEIYVRRLNVAQTLWEQAADSGTAMAFAGETLGGVPTTGNDGGISRNLTFSLQPAVVVAPDGSGVVAWRDGSNATFDLFLRRFHENEPTNLQQSEVGGTIIPVGGTSTEVDIVFSGVLVAESTSSQLLRMQLEVRPVTSALTGLPTHESAQVTSGSTASITFTGLPNVNYHWRARTLNAAGQGSPWISFGNNADGGVDFRINTTVVPGTGGPNVVNPSISSSSKDKCGLLGVEVLALLGLALIRRRRA